VPGDAVDDSIGDDERSLRPIVVEDAGALSR
jgi:hypothetical protein